MDSRFTPTKGTHILSQVITKIIQLNGTKFKNTQIFSKNF